MASQTGYNDGGGSGRGILSELRSRDLPSKRLLGKGLASVGYETEFKGTRFARKDFIGVPKGVFLKEAAVLVGLKDHKNIVKTHGWTVDRMGCSLVLEYMDDDLLGLLQKRKESQGSPSGDQSELSRTHPFELPEALDTMLQTARGMKYLHEQDILHGDLKTKNILVTRMNNGDENFLSVKVADFGLVRTKSKSMPFVSRQARKLDMVQWKAPENLEILLSEDTEETSSESDSNSDEEGTCSSGVSDRPMLSADVYSFAVTCSQILTGEDPFPNVNWKDLVTKIVSGELRPTLPAACPSLLRNLLVSCWGKVPDQRPTFFHICTQLERMQRASQKISVFFPVAETMVSRQKFRDSTGSPASAHIMDSIVEVDDEAGGYGGAGVDSHGGGGGYEQGGSQGGGGGEGGRSWCWDRNTNFAWADDYTDDDMMSTTATTSSWDYTTSSTSASSWDYTTSSTSASSWDYTTSSTSASSWDYNEGPETEEVGLDESTLMDQYVEALYQGRASTREAGLKGMINAFTSSILTNFAKAQCETLSSRFINSIKVGSGPEAAQGARALGLLAFTVGAGSNAETILSDAAPHLWKVAIFGPSIAARSSALQTLGVLAFIGAVDPESTEALMKLLWSIIDYRPNPEDQGTEINFPPGPVKVSALVAWSLLISTVDSQNVSSRYLQSSLPVLSSLLKYTDLGVRTAAGEAIALLYEMTDRSASTEEDEEDVKNVWSTDIEVLPISRSSNSSVARATISEDEVVEQMKALSVQAGGKGQAKKERAVQRSSFRELLTSVETGVAPQVFVKLPAGNTLKFNSWTKIIQLNVIRRFLSEGFETHMQGNELLHEIFDFVPQTKKPKDLPTKEKRMLSPNSIVSKTRTEWKNRQRLQKLQRLHGLSPLGPE